MRPSVTETIKIQISATRFVAHERQRYVDATLFDALHYAGRLTDRQHAAAARLYGWHRHAGLEPRSTQRYDVLRATTMEDDGEDAPGMTSDEARAALSALLRLAGGHAYPLAQLLAHMYSGPHWLATCREALDWLGDEWGLD